MERVTVKLTVFFEHPFWVGVFERVEENRCSVCRVVFGSQPKDYEVYEFVLQQYRHLRFSTGEAVEVKREKRKESKQIGISSKSQIALQQQREEMKLERRVESKQQRELEKKRKFQLKQEKRKQKHRGK